LLAVLKVLEGSGRLRDLYALPLVFWLYPAPSHRDNVVHTSLWLLSGFGLTGGDALTGTDVGAFEKDVANYKLAISILRPVSSYLTMYAWGLVIYYVCG
jgi:hypothetical protein